MNSNKAIGLFFFALSLQLTSSRTIFGSKIFKFLSERVKDDDEEVKKGDLRLGGDLWYTLYSEDDSGEKCELEIVNNFVQTILVCWVGTDGNLHHYYPINDGSIRDGSVSNHHVEFTHVGHSFLIIKPCRKLPKKIEDVTDEIFLCLYRPQAGCCRHVVHIAEAKEKKIFFGRDNKNHNISVSVSVEIFKIDDAEAAVVDTSKKRYSQSTISGFTIMYEDGVFEHFPSLHLTLEKEFVKVCELLPAGACEKLRNSTKLWINQTISFGKLSRYNVIITLIYCYYNPHTKANNFYQAKCGPRRDLPPS